MVQKENLAVFESYGISETEKVTPKKIGVHAYYINTYLPEFFESIPINLIFWLCKHHSELNLWHSYDHLY